jgi:hypothetical protein
MTGCVGAGTMAIAGGGAVCAAVVVVDQPDVTDAGLGSRATVGDAGGFLFDLARMAVGKQRPSSLMAWPEGQGLLHTASRWLATIVNRTPSGSSTGSVALTRSVNAFMARRVAGVHAPLSSPS